MYALFHLTPYNSPILETTHFADEDTEALRVGALLEVSQLVSGRVGVPTQSSDPYS